MKILFIAFFLLFSINTFANETQQQGQYLGAKIVDETPSWFKTTFLDLSEDLQEANDDNKHIETFA